MRFSKHYAAEEHAERVYAISAKAHIKVSHGSFYDDIAGARFSRRCTFQNRVEIARKLQRKSAVVYYNSTKIACVNNSL